MTRVSVNVSDEALSAIKGVMADRGITATEFLRRAIGYYKFVEDARKAGKKILIADKRGNIREVEFL